MKEHLKSSAGAKLYSRGKTLFHYLQQHAEERPEDPAYFYYGSSITWRDLFNQVQKWQDSYGKRALKRRSNRIIYAK